MTSQNESLDQPFRPRSAPGHASGLLGRAWRSLLLGGVGGIAIALVLGVVVAGPFVVGHRQDLPLEKLYGDFAVSVASRLSGGTSTNPLGNDNRAVSAGRNAYTGSCAACHGAKGDGKGVFGAATYPNATDLTSNDAKSKSDAQLFWITKNGLSFTGMPSFGAQYDDQAIWALVSYIRALQHGNARSIAVPTPTTDQFAMADISGTAEQRGAAVYYAQGCHYCHGAIGGAPGDLGLRRGSHDASDAVRGGRPGMPTYGPDLISDQQLTDLMAYLDTFRNGGIQPQGGASNGVPQGGQPGAGVEAE